MNSYGTLYVVATPIGNLGDITFRAIDILKSVDCIFCEDKRVTLKLLRHYDIQTHLIAYHSFSGFIKFKKAVELLKGGNSIAIVSDAGTPTISDPGCKLISYIRGILKNDTKINTIPGASAVISALAVSGSPASKFLFLGFLPRKNGRKKSLQKIAEADITTVFYESANRIIKTLEDLSAFIDLDREIIVAREMTKIHEEYNVGDVRFLIEHLKDDSSSLKGELTVIINTSK